MRALVVDDEPLVRSELTYALQRVARGCVVNEAENGSDALQLLKQAEYDVVFLDIRMPGISGLATAAALKQSGSRPYVVFVTAHDNHALEAFEVAASDYLLKPVTEQRLTSTLQRLGVGLGERNRQNAFQGRLAVEAGDRTLLVPVEDVRYVQARGHVITVALFDQFCRLRHTLEDSRRRLEAFGFLRVHRAFIVNPRHVLEVIPFAGGTYTLRMSDRARSEIPVSRHFAPLVRDVLGKAGWEV
jgi:two-component system, LytTR family, response regulator